MDIYILHSKRENTDETLAPNEMFYHSVCEIKPLYSAHITHFTNIQSATYIPYITYPSSQVYSI